MLLYDGRSYAFQWDLNISVIVPKATEGQDIEFSFSKDENAVTTKAYFKNDLIIADIPNALLKRIGFLNVYHTVEDEKGNRTIWRGQLRILKREKPDDYPGSIEEQVAWDSLNKRVTNLEEELPKYELEVGTETKLGGVKSSKEKNKIEILEDGTMQINDIDMVLDFIFNGGGADINEEENYGYSNS